MAIKRLYLENFRIHKTFLLEQEHDYILLEGPNGAGKTSVLEAISFLAPGKGLRNVHFDDAIRTGNTAWTIFAHLETNEDPAEIGMSYGASHRRTIKIDDKLVRSSAALLEKLRVIWLTPSQDELLAESKSLRRKFLDRLAYNFDAGHALEIARYEHALKSRLKLLKSGSVDPLWLTQLERVLAESSVKISAARLNAIERLKANLDIESEDFLAPQISLHCEVANNLSDESYARVLASFERARELDARVGRSLFGIHRADFIIGNPLRDLNASKSSTGELKIMLLSLVISQVRSLNEINKIKPILLLDDIFSHLDKRRSSALLGELGKVKAQIWITGTDFTELDTTRECEKYVKITV